MSKELLTIKQCPRCKERGKTWSGSDPKCAFPEGVFVTDNWNCATMNALRNEVANAPEWYGWNLREQDSSFGVLSISPSMRPSKEPIFIALSWYKDRGRTGQAWIFSEDETPVPLTYEEAENALRLIETEGKYQPVVMTDKE